ncbi:probable aquaporin NIP7-1 [Primulina eburnea]|uniref:probable aquaporin NIP7-1 n=1 Tax=Primulina eburnea TaxID=1245227 RepID=UPI003C6C3481
MPATKKRETGRMKATPFQDSFSPDVSPSTSTRFQPTNDHEIGYIAPPSNGNILMNNTLLKHLCEINPTLLRKVMAEALGTFLLMFCIGGIIGNMAFMGIKAGLMEYAVTAALTVIVLVFSIGSISGAHLNPAVTIAFATVGPFPLSEALLYVLAQVGGSVLAAYIVPLVYGIEAEIMMTRPLHGCAAAFWVEFFATFIVLFLTTSLFNNPKSLGELSGFVAGVTIGLGVLISGPVSGGSMNPARSLGPALISWRFDHLWVYLLAPTIGAIVGVLVYRILRLQGWSCESEICTTPLQGSRESLH